MRAVMNSTERVAAEATDRRRFMLSDAMILVAATAVGLGLIRGYLPEFYRDAREVRDSWPWKLLARLCLGIVACTPLLVSWSLAALGLRLRRPRPRLRRLLRQPGMVASCASGAGVMLGAIFFSAYFYRHWIGDFQGYGEGVMLGLFPICYAVAAAWVILVLGGRWRPERSWIDRLGRLLGVCWLLTFPALIACILS